LQILTVSIGRRKRESRKGKGLFLLERLGYRRIWEMWVGIIKGGRSGIYRQNLEGRRRGTVKEEAVLSSSEHTVQEVVKGFIPKEGNPDARER